VHDGFGVINEFRVARKQVGAKTRKGGGRDLQKNGREIEINPEGNRMV